MGIIDFFKKLVGGSKEEPIDDSQLASLNLDDLSFLVPKDTQSETSERSRPKSITFRVGNSNGYFFYALSEKIRSGNDVYAKIEACEESYNLLHQFVKDSLKDCKELPPTIYCRDRGPTLYAMTGQWDKAVEAVQICIAARAYQPRKSGSEALSNIMQMCDIGKRIVSYVSDHPGCLQKDIYKVLEISPEEKNLAKYFLRYNVVLRKEPYNKTNRLFLK